MALRDPESPPGDGRRWPEMALRDPDDPDVDLEAELLASIKQATRSAESEK